MSLGLLVVACSSAPDAASIAGAVLDGADGHPLVGAEVSLLGDTGRVTTGRDGHFSLRRGAALGVRVDADGYLAARILGSPDGPVTLWPDAPSEAAIEARLAELTEARGVHDEPDDPALTGQARAALSGGRRRPLTRDGLGTVTSGLGPPPDTIRIWRRGLDGSTRSCAGRVDVLELESYVAGVLAHEWISSWEDESLRAGAIAVRTYAWGWIDRGGKYDCADLDDTARSQVYRDARIEKVTQAVMDTAGLVITIDGELATGEYSAENGDPTAFGVEEPLCTGLAVRGHGRGMCQWGTQRWALDGRDHLWMATHYFPGAIVEGGIRGDREPFAASLLEPVAGLRLQPGSVTLVAARYRNDGWQRWRPSEVRLTTGDPSAFHVPDRWLSDSFPAAVDEDVRPDEVATFVVPIRAPEIAGTTTEECWLWHPEVGAFGDPIQLSVEVPGDEPLMPDAGPDDAGPVAPDEGPPPVDAGAPEPPARGGCAASRSTGGTVPWPLLALAVVLRQRRRR